ncbi:hypothetical protein Cs7R123_03390 [Catellatospora sp. TT07R-123]|uniref:hypothetical protein n=1 Tax=Catellatospora sp. TT07R-123 TaxID=2733863 RepID=UPI001AFDF2F5|nr:hypothetical protein [Catellatospora sp. TT07R-123]GHJ42997.1 hypothetical protein Cs7R123_03390 [Catellatospora sp. TT07R-123]
MTAKYQVVTYPNDQNVAQAAWYSPWVVNTRHDDVAYVYFQSGTVICLMPGESRRINDSSTDFYGSKWIAISSASTC